ncbi:hypothetical protein MKI84_01515 [Ancylobacter sp. A5.8]|uniref:hypothetical protein n=1 Tax=Ancylobacter gelatini TaxID=2919920 RepID=UPI001F4EE534|nr:hypothetical protein [Ancylobacter gelatini]MCJ8141588.1 hypothetical protein [Ancylobacter gelatini]
MRHAVMLHAALFALGMTSTALAAHPVAQTAGTPEATLPLTDVTWMNVCREQNALRRDARGRLVVVQVPRCNMVWVGKRYLFNGNYYADPNFILPL